MWKLTAAVIVVLIAGLVWGMAHVAAAESEGPICRAREDVIKILAEEVDLHLAYRWVTYDGSRMYELYLSSEKIRVAIVATPAFSPDVSCFIMEGTAWHNVMPKPQPKPDRVS